MNNPDLILITCEGKTEVLYFNILKRKFRLPTFVKVLPELKEGEHRNLGQHEKLIKRTAEKKEEFETELGEGAVVEAWAVCDRDEYKESFTKLRDFADSRGVLLAFSDPQFENFLLQHFSQNKSRSRKAEVERELSEKILQKDVRFGLYNKANLDWLDEMIGTRHAIVESAIKNADIFNNHTKQPFFTVQELVRRLLNLI